MRDAVRAGRRGPAHLRPGRAAPGPERVRTGRAGRIARRAVRDLRAQQRVAGQRDEQRPDEHPGTGQQPDEPTLRADLRQPVRADPAARQRDEERDDDDGDHRGRGARERRVPPPLRRAASGGRTSPTNAPTATSDERDQARRRSRRRRRTGARRASAPRAAHRRRRRRARSASPRRPRSPAPVEPRERPHDQVRQVGQLGDGQHDAADGVEAETAHDVADGGPAREDPQRGHAARRRAPGRPSASSPPAAPVRSGRGHAGPHRPGERAQRRRLGTREQAGTRGRSRRRPHRRRTRAPGRPRRPR